MKVSIDQLKVGDGGKIVSIETKEPQIYLKLMNLGFIPGSEVRILQKSPAYLFQVGFTQVALDWQTCRLIQVLTSGSSGA